MKFTIRDLFLVTVIVVLVLGWLLDRYTLEGEILKLTRGVQALQSLLEENGARITELENLLDSANQSWRQLPTSKAPTRNSPKP